MKFSKFSYLMVFLGAFTLAFVGCSSSSSPSADSDSANSTTSASSSSLSQSDAVVLASASASAVEADIHNFGNPTLPIAAPVAPGGGGGFHGWLFPGLGAGFPFGFGEEALMWSPAQACVSVDVKSDTATDKDVLYTFDCQNLTGTYELISTSDDDGATMQAIAQLTFSSSVTGYKNVIDDTYTVQRDSHEVVTISKQFDDQLTLSANTYEKKGNLQMIVDPVTTMNTSADHDVKLSGDFDLIKNGADLGDVVVSSAGLKKGSCGFDGGSIEFKTANDDYVVTFEGCGKVSVTDNGQVISP
jgi:hypothetical protein